MDDYLLSFDLYPPGLTQRRSLTESVLGPHGGGGRNQEEEEGNIDEEEHEAFVQEQPGPRVVSTRFEVAPSSFRNKKEIERTSASERLSSKSNGVDLPETYPYGLITLKGTVKTGEGKKLKNIFFFFTHNTKSLFVLSFHSSFLDSHCITY